MENIKLNFINRSNDTGKSSVVIFQKNVAETYSEIAIAWRVIKNCGPLDNHPFVYPTNFQLSANDSYGNYTKLLTAYAGQAFHVVQTTSGNILQLASFHASSPQEVEVKNVLPRAAINVDCYRDGKLLSIKTGIAPQQKAVFEFKPVLCLGVVSQVEEGEVMNSTILSKLNAEINLTGILSADIVMTGGGPGKSATPFLFTLENVRYV